MGNNSSNRSAQREAVLDDRRARVASFKVQGFSVRQIVAALAKTKCLNPDTKKPWTLFAVQSDLEALTARWQAEALRDVSKWKAEELAKLDRLESQAWAAWERGIGRKQTRTTKTGRVDKEGTVIAEPEVSLKTEVLNGDPRYLQVALDCQDRRAKLLGLDAPAKYEAAGPNGGPIPILQARVDIRTLNDQDLATLGDILAKAEPLP